MEKLDTKAVAITLTLIQIQTKRAENSICILHPDKQDVQNKLELVWTKPLLVYLWRKCWRGFLFIKILSDFNPLDPAVGLASFFHFWFGHSLPFNKRGLSHVQSLAEGRVRCWSPSQGRGGAQGQQEEPILPGTASPHSLSEAGVQTCLFVLLLSVLVPSKCAAVLFDWPVKVPDMQQSLGDLNKKIAISQKWVMTFMCLLLVFR